MHAEDEFSAGSYGSAKRDAVRLLSGEFRVRILVEGPDHTTVNPLIEEIDRLVALGALGHLPLGGQKTRGSGWGRWEPSEWVNDDVIKERSWKPDSLTDVHRELSGQTASSSAELAGQALAHPKSRESAPEKVRIEISPARIEGANVLTLDEAAKHARAAIRGPVTAWWCEPSIDFAVTSAPAVFGRDWPDGNNLRVDEVVFFAQKSSWRAAHTGTGLRSVLIREIPDNAEGVEGVILATVVETPARLHADTTRFAAALRERGWFVVREWHVGDRSVGYTLVERKR
jgi:hypothetical protein